MYWGLCRHSALHGVEHKQGDSGRKPNRHCSQSFNRGAIHIKIMGRFLAQWSAPLRSLRTLTLLPKQWHSARYGT
jgi:hypothetical protein